MASERIDSAYIKEQVPSFRVHSAGAATSYVLAAEPAIIEQLVVTNNTGTAGFLQIHDAVSLPANTAVPLLVVPLPADTTIGFDFSVYCAVGAVAAISTTKATLTISANAALFFATVTHTTK